MSKKYYLRLIVILVYTTLISCTSEVYDVEVSNTMAVERENESVELLVNKLPELIASNVEKYGIYDKSTKQFLTSQVIDNDMDGSPAKDGLRCRIETIVMMQVSGKPPLYSYSFLFFYLPLSLVAFLYSE